MLVDDDSRSMPVTRMLDSLHDLDGLASDDSGAGGMAAHHDAAGAHDPSAGYSPLDGFDFRYHDQIGPAAGHGARLVATFSLKLAGTLYGMHQCIKVRCTRDERVLGLRPPFAFVESREDRAALLPHDY
jgi:hypothetical protein